MYTLANTTGQGMARKYGWVSIVKKSKINHSTVLLGHLKIILSNNSKTLYQKKV